MTLRPDHIAIASRVPEGARVLDVGCHDGALLALLREERGAKPFGLELDEAATAAALARGLTVMHGDAGKDLAAYPDDAFDVAVLSKTIQEMRRPEAVLAELRRIAPEILISFRNYGYWRRRLSLLATGRMPAATGVEWHQAAALHPCTLTDMVALVDTLDLDLVAMAPLTAGRVGSFRRNGKHVLNWSAAEAILHLRRR